MITSDELVKAFNEAGLDTPEKVAAYLGNAKNTLALRQVEIAIDALNIKRRDALAPIENERISLENDKAALIADIGKG